jgi:hypothetical protein
METTQVPLRDIKTHAGLQPRDLGLLRLREQARQQEQTEMHIHDMAELLKADPRAELVALELAEVDGALFVVDGHHRLNAYKRAKRETVPAQVQAMTWKEASHASKLANISHTKLEMRPAQKRNALWHHLAYETDNGTRELFGDSQRRLAARFGVHRDTLARMLSRLPEVEPEAYPPECRDAITGWPHWKFVAAPAGDMFRRLTPDAQLEWRARKFVAGHMKLLERWGMEAAELAFQMMAADAPSEDDRATAAALREALAVASEEPGELF